MSEMFSEYHKANLNKWDNMNNELSDYKIDIEPRKRWYDIIERKVVLNLFI